MLTLYCKFSRDLSIMLHNVTASHYVIFICMFVLFVYCIMLHMICVLTPMSWCISLHVVIKYISLVCKHILNCAFVKVFWQPPFSSIITNVLKLNQIWRPPPKKILSNPSKNNNNNNWCWCHQIWKSGRRENLECIFFS